MERLRVFIIPQQSPGKQALEMNDRQNMVLAITLVSCILAVVYLCPWRIASSGEITWSPIYQQPLKYARSYGVGRGRTTIEEEEAQIAYSIMALQVIAIVGTGGGLYFLVSGSKEGDDELPDGTED
jgi:hypothetical protein